MKKYLAMLLLVGCVSEGDRLLNEQNYHAGKFIAENAVDGNVAIAGSDVSKNSEVLLNNLGQPKNPVGSYSASASASAREQSKAEHEAQRGLLGMIKGVFASNPYTAGIMTALSGLLAWRRRKNVMQLAQVVGTKVLPMAVDLFKEPKKGKKKNG